MHDPHNKLFTLAADFIQYSNRSVFLTGKAGTGKTTFLKYIRESTIKQTAVVAPTGVAAINAGGVTIHSFFQLPFTPFIPESKGFERNEKSIDRHHLLGRIKLNRERRQVLQQLELLIIDEISMVRCDLLDAIDTVLRHFRFRHNEPFGGVQVLFIGDMFQLPPVIPDEEWDILSQFYNSPFFFDSKVIQQQPPVHIELDKIYRQNEQKFIYLLNKVRNNEMDEDGFNVLNSRYNPSFQPAKEDGYIILTTHNYKADAINIEELNKLSAKPVTYKATITGDFNEKSYPADHSLLLKPGAQVMFIKNDFEKIRRYYNGKIGTIKKMDDDSIYVECKNDENLIEVKKEKWESLRYTLNQASQQVEEEVTGTFEQFPLRLAWAITIHKSQGLTFEKAIIDAEAAFASGQVYVALSRCTTFEGIVLKSRVAGSGLFNDAHIVHFAKQKSSAENLPSTLLEAKNQYQSSVLRSLFDFRTIQNQANQVLKGVEEHLTAFNPEAKPWLESVIEKLDALDETAKKFQPQLSSLLEQNILPESNDVLQQRLQAASNYFVNQLQSLIQIIPQSPAITDSKQFALAYNEDIKEMFASLCKKAHDINGCKKGFKADEFNIHKNAFTLPQLTVNAYAGTSTSSYHKIETAHPVLYRQLKQLRDNICAEDATPVYLVASSATLDEIVRYLPQTKDELLSVSGFGKSKIEKFGQRFLDIITEYCNANNLSSLIHEKPTKRQRKESSDKPDTKAESYRLFKEGKQIAEIAIERKLTANTIEGHLSHYVQKGIISVEEIVAKEKIVLIEPLAKSFEGGSITPIKENLGDNITFGEIRLVLAGIAFEKGQQKQD